MIAASFVLIVACVGASPVQDDAGRLVEQLDSEDGSVRGKALQKLVELGEGAEPALRKALGSPSSEVAERARSLLYRLDISRTVTRTLAQHVPGLVDRLWKGGDQAWTGALLDLFEQQGWGETRFLDLQGADLSPLVVRALKGADDEETTKILQVCADYRLPEASDFCLRRVSDPQADFNGRSEALRVLTALRRKGCLPTLLGVLRDPEDVLREGVLNACARLGWPEVIPAVREIARRPREGIAGVAAQALSRLGAVEAIPDIVKIASPEAYDALQRLGDTAAIPLLTSAIAEGSEGDPDQAVRTLTALAVRLPYEKLAPMLDHPQPRVRASGIRVLAAMGEVQAVRRIVELLPTDPAPPVRHEAFNALLAMDPERLVPLLESMARDKDPLIRQDALSGRALLTPEARLSLVLSLVEDPKPEVRTAAAETAGSLPASKVRDPLRRLLEDREDSVRIAATFALAGFEEATVVPRLVDLLKHPQESVRKRAVAALGAVKTEPALERLRGLSKDPQNPLRATAWEALVSCRGKELLEQVQERLEDRDPAVQSFALQTLTTWGEFGSARRVGTMLRETRDRQVLAGAIDYLFRRGTEDSLLQIADVVFELPGDLWPGILETLSYCGNPRVAEHFLQKVRKSQLIGPALAEATAVAGLPEAVPAWREVLKSGSHNDRRTALEALGKIGGPDLLADVKPFLNSRFAGVRAAALRAMALLQGDAAALSAATLIQDRDGTVREKAAEVLGELGAKAQIPLLIAALKDPDSDCARAAARALAGMGRNEGVEVLLRWGPVDGEKLTELNGLRAPLAWTRMETRRLTKTLWGEKQAVRRTLQEESGLTRIDLPRGGRDRDQVVVAVPSYGGRLPLRRAWESILSEDEDLLLEDPQGARIVKRWEAVRSWSLWWEQERGRKK
jgi:HEAT repeat protein